MLASRRSRAPSPAIGAVDRRLAGRWAGFLDGYEFPSGSSRLELTIYDPAGRTDGVGNIVFGEGTPPSIASTAEPFPPAHYSGTALDATPVFDGVWEGFQYPLALVMGTPSSAGPAVTATTFSANSFDLFAAWCAQRTQYHATSGTCAPRSYPVPRGDGVECDLHALGSYLRNPEESEVLGQSPCHEADICLGRCACDRGGCSAWQVSDIDIEALLDGDAIEAQVVLTWPALAVRVRLARVAAREEGP